MKSFGKIIVAYPATTAVSSKTGEEEPLQEAIIEWKDADGVRNAVHQRLTAWNFKDSKFVAVDEGDVVSFTHKMSTDVYAGRRFNRISVWDIERKTNEENN